MMCTHSLAKSALCYFQIEPQLAMKKVGPVVQLDYFVITVCRSQTYQIKMLSCDCTSQVFHWSMIPDELYRVYKRLGHLKYLLLSWVVWFLKFFFLNILGPNWIGFHTSFGDGSEIPEFYMKHVRDVMWSNMVFNRWEQGDVLMIDNFRVSHGRQVGQLSVMSALTEL